MKKRQLIGKISSKLAVNENSNMNSKINSITKLGSLIQQTTVVKNKNDSNRAVNIGVIFREFLFRFNNKPPRNPTKTQLKFILEKMKKDQLIKIYNKLFN